MKRRLKFKKCLKTIILSQTHKLKGPNKLSFVLYGYEACPFILTKERKLIYVMKTKNILNYKCVLNEN
jgi:hypothetical protein